MSRPKPKIVMTPEMEEKFESELLWCIQQLQHSLKSGKLSKREGDIQLKSLNVLMGNSSIVKKRQTMRSLFGDYRAKMAEEEKKFSKSHVICMKPIKPHKNSRPLQKPQSTNKIDECEEITKSISGIKIDTNNTKDRKSTKTTFKFVPSDGSFRFNFVEE